MNFYARNRYLVIRLEEEKKENQSGVLLPEEYVKTSAAIRGLKVAKLLSASPESQFSYDIGNYVVFESHMMQTFHEGGQDYSIIPESSVYGVFKDGPDYTRNNEY